MAKFKIVLLKHGYPSVRHEQQIISRAGGELFDTETLSDDEALHQCEEADGILVRWRSITPDMIDRFRRCKVIVRYGVGYDNVELTAATRARIMVSHVPRYCLDEVSNHTIALLMACVRNLIPKHKKMERGGWDLNPLEPLYRTAGRTLGLVGLGNIGQAVARKMSGWDMHLLATDPFIDPAKAQGLGVELVSLETLLRQSDYVSLHVPLLPETQHLISYQQLALMKPTAILINTARGPVLDNDALFAALARGRLAQAGLDVFDPEPPSPESPLRQHPRVVLSDHIAWYSEESQAELQITAAEEAVRACTGKLPIAIANPEVLQELGRSAEWVPNDNARWQLKRLAARAEKLGSKARGV